jgi:ABC-type nickel/cobalt efflux system permease component RcnA
VPGRKRFLLGGALVLVFLTVGGGPAFAHPLGNFTINTAARVVVRPDEVLVDYVVDMAEIPAFRERQAIDRDGDGIVSASESADYRAASCGRLAEGLATEVDGRTTPLAPRGSTLAFHPGQAGLRTLRLVCHLSVPLTEASSHRVVVEDANYLDRIGWHEVTAAGDRATLIGSNVPAVSPSDLLRSYPKGVLPIDVRSASIGVRPGGPPLADDRPTEGGAARGGLLADLASRPDLSAIAIAAMVAVALAVGAIHALGPGHGKALIGAYLVGSGGTLRHAVAVGAAVSVMHTASVLGLGVLVLSAERLLSPERVYPWLGLASGLVALVLGSTLLISRIHALTERRRHGHDHAHPARPLSRRGLVALAFSGGILPSPSALVVLLGSVSLGRTALGLLLIAAFSVGLAASLVAVGALAIRARGLADGRVPAGLLRLAPVGSAALIAAVGLALTARGLIGL